MIKGFRIIIGLIFAFSIIACSLTTATVFKKQGSYPSPGNRCVAILKVSPLGGFLQLFIQVGSEEPIHIADDVTGFLWVDEKSLVFSASPIYGKPGIFKAKCDSVSPKLKTIIGPENINSGYPDGADYFELKEIKGRNLQFFYTDDVDSIDFNNFRTEKNLRSVLLPK